MDRTTGFGCVPYDQDGAIGTALTKADAIREACAVIEAMALRPEFNWRQSAIIGEKPE
jgi:hypothetical protein